LPAPRGPPAATLFCDIVGGVEEPAGGAHRGSARRGHQAFGENYVQEALEKMDALPGLEWHLIAHCRATRRAWRRRFAWVHTLEREKIARRLSEQRPVGLPRSTC